MRREMIGGTPYLTAVRSEQNEELVLEFRRQAAYYNAVDVEGGVQHYYDLPWPVAQAQEIDRAIAELDICYVEGREVTVKKEKKQTKAAKKKQKVEEPAPSAVTLFPILGVDANYMSDRRHLDAYETTNAALGECIRNGDWDIPLRENIFKLQVCRLMEMESRARAALAVAGAKDIQ
jgi:hypothetical protein